MIIYYPFVGSIQNDIVWKEQEFKPILKTPKEVFDFHGILFPPIVEENSLTDKLIEFGL